MPNLLATEWAFWVPLFLLRAVFGQWVLCLPRLHVNVSNWISCAIGLRFGEHPTLLASALAYSRGSYCAFHSVLNSVGDMLPLLDLLLGTCNEAGLNEI